MGASLMGNSSVPNYVKITATAIVASTYVAALAVAVDVYVTQGAQAQLPGVVTFILGTGLSMALGVLGIHQGASLVETPAPTQQQQTGGNNNAGS
jgi:hypothetical protein